MKSGKHAFMSIVIVMVVACSFLMPSMAESKDWKTEETTIRVEASAWMLKKLAIEDAAKQFMAKYPNVTVEVSAMQDDSLNNYLLNWATGDIEVDLGFGGAGIDVGKLAARNLLEPWNDFYTGDFTRDQFLTYTVELPKRGDEYFATPLMVEAMSLQANKALMAEAGLMNADGTPMAPKTLDELYEFAKKMTKGTGEVKDVYGFSWNFTNFADQQLQCAVNALGGNRTMRMDRPILKPRKFWRSFVSSKSALRMAIARQEKLRTPIPVALA